MDGPTVINLIEDSGTTIVSGQLTATDPDQGATQTWQVVGGTVPHGADYSFAIDNLKIVLAGSTIVDDPFSTAPANGDGNYSVAVNGVQGTLVADTDANGQFVTIMDADHGLPGQCHRYNHARGR